MCGIKEVFVWFAEMIGWAVLSKRGAVVPFLVGSNGQKLIGDTLLMET